MGLSQNELARRAGVNHPTLFKIESGQRSNPSIGTIVKIARALGTTAEVLAGAEPEEKRRRSKAAAAEHLAAGGIALVEELASLRRRVDALEAWRRDQEGRTRKREAR
jgi:transcriptional regulator with XRE-family HTH domain